MPELNTLETFALNELADETRETAIDAERHINVTNVGWWEWAYEDATEIASLFGITIEQIYFSGFYSQGDGACFIGNWAYAKDCVAQVKAHAPRDKTLHELAEQWHELHAATNFAMKGTVYQIDGLYSHKHSVAFKATLPRQDTGDDSLIEFDSEWFTRAGIDSIREGKENSPRDDDPLPPELAHAIDVMREFMDWLYRHLRDEYEGLLTDEAVGETLITQGYRFTDEGERIPHVVQIKLTDPRTGREA